MYPMFPIGVSVVVGMFLTGHDGCDVLIDGVYTLEVYMKFSARNQIKGKVVKVTKGATTSHVQVDIGSGVIVTASITNEAVADLKLKKGDKAWAVVKASDVMIGKK